ncbi:MAG: hypothetical protein DWB42_04380 [Chloroflexi bacterium]|nr:hypothetical protein [Chloroflexota bacterium]MDL1885218.1 hypothetical protein [Anaerolineae bacterium CFX8]
MASSNVLRWLDGRGWLVLSGGGGQTGAVRAQALGRAAADGGVAYVSLGNHDGWSERALADMDGLGAPPGYIVDALTEDDRTLTALLAEAGIVVIEDGPDAAVLRSGLIGAAAAGIQTAFENGAVILAEGLSAMVFGAWVAKSAGELLPGLAWLENALVLPGVTSAAQSELAQNVLREHPAAIAVGVGVGSALALGPDGEVEAWGQRQVTVALGSDYTSPKGD